MRNFDIDSICSNLPVFTLLKFIAFSLPLASLLGLLVRQLFLTDGRLKLRGQPTQSRPRELEFIF